MRKFLSARASPLWLAGGLVLSLLIGLSLLASQPVLNDAPSLTAKSGIIYLPNLPEDCDKVLSIVNAINTGVSVAYISKTGNPRMVQYWLKDDNKYNTFFFRFENER